MSGGRLVIPKRLHDISTFFSLSYFSTRGTNPFSSTVTAPTPVAQGLLKYRAARFRPPRASCCCGLLVTLRSVPVVIRSLTSLLTAGCLCLMTCIAAEPVPREYTCIRAKTAPVIDGQPEEAMWQQSPWTSDFVDIEGDVRPKPRFRTRAKMLWDDKYLYIAAELEEPDVWATLKEHDSVIFRDNDFEVFLDPGGQAVQYFEFEINALNTGWDLYLPKPYRKGGKADNTWEIPGLRTAVHVHGTLNKPDDHDRGWTVELAFPWEAFRGRARGNFPPLPGDVWRMNFSRVEWRSLPHMRAGGEKEDNWVWSPQGAVNMHIPEQWGFVRFSN